MRGAQFDVLVIGRGIVGLAHALAAARFGLSTAVLDRETASVGASVRNFGFVTVTGQQAGITWRRARRSRDVWAEVAERAGIDVHHRGLLLVARRPEALAVVEEFAAGPMGEGCHVLRGADLPPPIRAGHAGALHSPHELRVESRDAVPRLAAWLAETHGTVFLPRAMVYGVEPGEAATSGGRIAATHIVVAPGADLVTLFPDEYVRRRVTLCKLHMLRVAAPGWRLPAAVMSDLGLVRYLGYRTASLPALQARLAAEQPRMLADGIHLIAVQGADGSLVVGDSHRYADSPDPFQPRDIDDRILSELSAVLDLPAPDVLERWTGVYPSGPETAFSEAVRPGVRLVNVTSGTGASTAFAIAEETLADLLGRAPPPHVQEIPPMSTIKAVILDWAGTVVDFGSRAPMDAFVRAFAEFGVDIEVADARGPMGMAKWDHIRAVGQSPRVAAAWRARHGRAFGEADVDAIFAVFEPLNVASVVDHAAFIPGALEAIAELRAGGAKIGSTTGYTRPIMDRLLPVAAEGGYAPDIVVCAGDLPAGRPSPLMMWHAMAHLGVWPASRVVKVDDTPVGIGEGVAAGTWTVGVALTGNIAGMSEAELNELPPDARGLLRVRATTELEAAGADIVIDGISELPIAVFEIEARIAAGETPRSRSG